MVNIAPIKIVILGKVYYCFNHVIYYIYSYVIYSLSETAEPGSVPVSSLLLAFVCFNDFNVCFWSTPKLFLAV